MHIVQQVILGWVYIVRIVYKQPLIYTIIYFFYTIQYCLPNLNAFIILVAIGYTFYLYLYKDKETQKELMDQNNSPMQLINQINVYFYINPFIAISFFITLFSFLGIPLVIRFYTKQMVLSAALYSGYVFMALIAILTSLTQVWINVILLSSLFFLIIGSVLGLTRFRIKKNIIYVEYNKPLLFFLLAIIHKQPLVDFFLIYFFLYSTVFSVELKYMWM